MLRKSETMSGSDIIITDSELEPYYITKPRVGGFTICKRAVRKGKDYVQVICFPSSLKKCVEVIIDAQIKDGEQKEYTLPEYLSKWEKKMKQITQKLDI